VSRSREGDEGDGERGRDDERGGERRSAGEELAGHEWSLGCWLILDRGSVIATSELTVAIGGQPEMRGAVGVVAPRVPSSSGDREGRVTEAAGRCGRLHAVPVR
jgi:hypothetical protein